MIDQKDSDNGSASAATPRAIHPDTVERWYCKRIHDRLVLRHHTDAGLWHDAGIYQQEIQRGRTAAADTAAIARVFEALHTVALELNERMDAAARQRSDVTAPEVATSGPVQPDGKHSYHGIDFARWGQCVVPAGEKLDPVPAVYSSADDIEMAELRMDFATAEALSARLLAAVAYERAKAGA